MAYFNNGCNFYSNASAAGEPGNIYPFLNVTPAAEETGSQLPNPPVTHWDGFGQPDPMVGSWVNLPTPTGHESMASVTSDTPQVDWYTQQPYADQCWLLPETQPELPGFSSSSSSLANALGTDAPTVVPPPRSFPLNYWGNSQSGPSTSAFYPQNVQTTHPLSTGLARTERIQTTRFQPYGTYRTPGTEHVNAEAGPSTLVPPPVPYVGSPTPEPSGGLPSETSADAEQTNPTKEEDEVPPQESERTQVPPSEVKPRPYRVRERSAISRLSDWVQRQGLCEEHPKLLEVLGAVVGVIQTIRPVLNEEPYVAKVATKEVEAPSRNARKERERRATEREWYEELSRRYPRGRRPWARHALLALVARDLESNPVLQDPPEPAPQPSTPTAEGEDLPQKPEDR